MTQSHFADASGVAAGSQSTPYDLLKVTSLDMTDPVFASLVRQSSDHAAGGRDHLHLHPAPRLRRRHRGEVRVHHGRRRVRRPRRRAPGARGAHPPPGRRDRASRVRPCLAQAGLHALALVTAMAPVVSATPVLHRGQVVAARERGRQDGDRPRTATASLLTWPGAKATMVFHPAPAPHRPGAPRCRWRAPSTSPSARSTSVVPVRLEQDVLATHHAPAPLLNA